jgi:hypothetical protein
MAMEMELLGLAGMRLGRDEAMCTNMGFRVVFVLLLFVAEQLGCTWQTGDVCGERL